MHSIFELTVPGLTPIEFALVWAKLGFPSVLLTSNPNISTCFFLQV